MTSYRKDCSSVHQNSKKSGSQTAHRELLPIVSQRLQHKNYCTETNKKLKFCTKGIYVINKISAIWKKSLPRCGTLLYTMFRVLLCLRFSNWRLHKPYQIFMLWNYIIFHEKKYLKVGLFLLQFLFSFRILIPCKIAQNAEQKLVEVFSRKKLPHVDSEVL